MNEKNYILIKKDTKVFESLNERNEFLKQQLENYWNVYYYKSKLCGIYGRFIQENLDIIDYIEKNNINDNLNISISRKNENNDIFNFNMKLSKIKEFIKIENNDNYNKKEKKHLKFLLIIENIIENYNLKERLIESKIYDKEKNKIYENLDNDIILQWIVYQLYGMKYIYYNKFQIYNLFCLEISDYSKKIF